MPWLENIDFMFLDDTPGLSSLKFMYSDSLAGEMVYARPAELSDIAVTLGDIIFCVTIKML